MLNRMRRWLQPEPIPREHLQRAIEYLAAASVLVRALTQHDDGLSREVGQTLACYLESAQAALREAEGA